MSGKPDVSPSAARAASKAILRSYILMAAWISLSAVVILFNKYILSYAGFPYPVTLTMIHMAFCSVVTAAMMHGGHYVGLKIEKVDMQATTFVRHIIPIGALFAVVLWLGNTCYLYLAVSFIQMLKAMMPVAVFLVGVMVGTEKYSHRAALNMVVVAAGVALATYGEMSFVLVGVILQVIAIFCESFRIVLVQMLMQQSGVKLNSIQTMYYVSPCCFLFLCIPFTFMEAPTLWHSAAPVPVLVLVANAACAFCLNVSVYMLIGSTSALTLNVAGVVKDWLLIALSVLLFATPVSSTSLFGYLVAFAGVKYWDMQRIAAIRVAASATCNKIDDGDNPSIPTSPASPTGSTPLLAKETERTDMFKECGSPSQGATPRQSA